MSSLSPPARPAWWSSLTSSGTQESPHNKSRRTESFPPVPSPPSGTATHSPRVARNSTGSELSPALFGVDDNSTGSATQLPSVGTRNPTGSATEALSPKLSPVPFKGTGNATGTRNSPGTNSSHSSTETIFLRELGYYKPPKGQVQGPSHSTTSK